MLIILFSHIPFPLPILRPHFRFGEVLHLSLSRTRFYNKKHENVKLNISFPVPSLDQHPKNIDSTDHGRNSAQDSNRRIDKGSYSQQYQTLAKKIPTSKNK